MALTEHARAWVTGLAIDAACEYPARRMDPHKLCPFQEGTPHFDLWWATYKRYHS